MQINVSEGCATCRCDTVFIHSFQARSNVQHGLFHVQPAPSRAPARHAGIGDSLRREGELISGNEFRIAVPLLDLLLLGPTSRHQNGGGATHMADLIKPGAIHMGSACKPLFNPAIEKSDARGFLLSGYEINFVTDVPVHVEQVWLVRPLTSADPFSS